MRAEPRTSKKIVRLPRITYLKKRRDKYKHYLKAPTAYLFEEDWDTGKGFQYTSVKSLPEFE